MKKRRSKIVIVLSVIIMILGLAFGAVMYAFSQGLLKDIDKKN